MVKVTHTYAHCLVTVDDLKCSQSREHGRGPKVLWSIVGDTCFMTIHPRCYFYHFFEERTIFTISRQNKTDQMSFWERNKKESIQVF